MLSVLAIGLLTRRFEFFNLNQQRLTEFAESFPHSRLNTDILLEHYSATVLIVSTVLQSKNLPCSICVHLLRFVVVEVISTISLKF